MKTCIIIISGLMLFLPGCGKNIKTIISSPEPVGQQNQVLATYWFDKETSTVHTIISKGGEKRVVSIIKYRDGAPLEIMKIIRSVDKNGMLHWAYFVPSTKYIVELTMVSITGNEITFEWKNRSFEGDVKHGRDILV